MISVYAILCLSNGRVYVGSSTQTRKRWRHHKEDLRKGKHHCRHLQRCWDKYSEGAFFFAILEEPGSRDELQAREQHYIDDLKSALLNSSPTAGGNTGVVWSDESRKRQSDRVKGTKNPAQAEIARKRHSGSKSHFAVLQDADVIEIVTKSNAGWNGVMLAEHFNVTPATISQILVRKTWTTVTDRLEIKARKRFRRCQKRNG